jgi:hypothetical protein
VAIEGAALRRRILISSAFLSLAAIAGCKSGALDLANRTEEEVTPPSLAGGIEVADPRAASQLVSGWRIVENNAWRWTARKFAVVLRPPIGAARRGAMLRLNFTLPQVVFSRFKAVTLTASIQGTRLAPETYNQPGAAVYTREVPASLLSGHSARIDFELDHAFIPDYGDPRELGLIAHRVALESK